MVVMAALKDAAASARSVVNVVVVMAGVVAVAVVKVVQTDEVKGANHERKIVLRGAQMDDLKAVNHARTVEEKVGAASAANVARKERHAKSAQLVTHHSALKVERPANLVKAANNVNHASPAKVAATAVNVVVVTVQNVAVNALSATRQSKTLHSPTRRLWLRSWAASQSSVWTHHKVSGLHVASATTAVVSVASAMAAVASAVMTAPKAAGMT